ncbi:hypothetical protein L1049_011165 [Liquidambar formosana]|uniref:HhH-GPD domain-containing protein n=1 Tax=Liquidambar formosana TaxID=63359 RepID=A0AAP0X2H3_LIQFO
MEISVIGMLPSLTKINRSITLPGSYAQAFGSDSARWNNNPLAELLGIKNAASMAPDNSTMNRSNYVANRPLIPNSHSQVNSNWRESNTASSFLTNNNCSGSGLWNNSLPQIPQCGFPVPYRANYNLNSPPRTETDAASSITNSFPFAPVTPDQAKKSDNNQLSEILTLSADETSSQEKDKPDNQITSIGNEAIEHHCDELLQNIVESSSAAMSTPFKEKSNDKVSDQGIDLNKTPQQKPPKRRKHRPKVIKEGKPKRTPKPTKPQNPNKENPSGKRKYVRKNGLTTSATQPADVRKETTGPSAGTAASSCRKVLNFDLEKTTDESQSKLVGQPEEMQHGIMWAFNLNSDSQDTELCKRTDSVSGTKSAVQMGQQNGVMVENRHAGPTNNLIRSMNRMPADYMSLPERHAPPAPSTTMKDLQMKNSNVIASNVNTGYAATSLNSHKNGYTPVHQHTHAEGIGQIFFQAKTTQENFERAEQLKLQSSLQSVLENLANSNEARGSKRGYCHTIEQTHPRTLNLINSSLMCQEIFQGHEYDSNRGNPGEGISESHKKKKSGNGFYTDMPGIPSHVTAVEEGSQQVKMKGRNEVDASQFTSHINHKILNSYFESSSAPKKLNDGSNKFTADWYTPSAIAGHSFPKQQNTSELLSHTERLGEKRSNRSTQVHDFNSLTAIEKYNFMPVTPPKRVPTSGDGHGIETFCPDTSTKNQTAGPKVSNLPSYGTDKVLLQENREVHDYQKSSMKTKSPLGKQKYQLLIDEIICRLKALNLNDESNETVGQEQNALVPYKGDSTIVPYQEFDPIKKRRQRPKVDLDPETNRVWKQLMGKEGSEGVEGTEKDKEKWWEEERNVFRGRADSFIARMHLVQGDRRFSQWKGSVVDSVIGVFLTQNVSDHLSSSAFMSLAARFPCKSASDNITCSKDGKSILVEEPDVCILDPDDTIEWFENVSGQQVCNQRSMTSKESSEHRRGSLSSGTKRTTLGETHSRRVEEQIISPLDSFDSSILQTKINSLVSRNLPQMEKTAMFKEFHIHGNGSQLFNESSAFTFPINSNNPHLGLPIAPSSSHRLHMTQGSGLEGDCYEVLGKECFSSGPSTASGITTAKDVNWSRVGQMEECIINSKVQWNGLLRSQETPTVNPNALSSRHSMHQQSSSHRGPQNENNQNSCNNHQHERTKTFQLEGTSKTLAKMQNSSMQQVSNVSKLTQETFDVEDRISVVNKQIHLENQVAQPNSKEQDHSSGKAYDETNTITLKAKKGKVEGEKKNAVDWDTLRKQVQSNNKRERSKDAMDSLDYERMRCADVDEISNAIKERGMNNMLAERIKDFLNRIVREHGSIDLEWLRDAPPDKAKDYLLSIRGLGLKSVECVRLLTLHHLAFPVDTNVGRIAVRLGWVPLQPLPESLQLHLLEMYPILESIQKYLWPRLCKMDQRTLYELHYQMITFGKVFCTKNKPNCNACPMRGECRHFASAFASARLALPGPEEKSIVNASVPIATERNPAVIITPMPLPPPGNTPLIEARHEAGKCEPIIEVPATPEPECTEVTESDIEDAFYEDPDEIPTIKLNIEEFTLNLQNYMQENNLDIQDGEMSKALVAMNPEAASIPTQKLKNVSRLRTEHQVYELPDTHPLLKGFERREPDDPSPYLLAIWTPGETANSTQPPERQCGSQDPSKMCNEKTCFSCSCIREANSQTVRGTLLIPCRTAMRGSFPLNGTYFQVNEVFADHDSSLDPIDVPRAWIWNLPRRTVYFGTSVSTIFKGLSTEGIQYCFWRGFVCVRGFDHKTRAPRPLMARLHFPASKLAKTKNEGK